MKRAAWLLALASTAACAQAPSFMAAWMLVQHADADPAFQARALAEMEAAVAKGTAAREDEDAYGRPVE